MTFSQSNLENPTEEQCAHLVEEIAGSLLPESGALPADAHTFYAKELCEVISRRQALKEPNAPS